MQEVLPKPLAEQLKAALASFGRVFLAALAASVSAALVSVREVISQNGISIDVLTSQAIQNSVSASVVGAFLLTVANWVGKWNDKFGRVPEPIVIPDEPAEADESYHEEDVNKEPAPEPVLEDDDEATVDAELEAAEGR